MDDTTLVLSLLRGTLQTIKQVLVMSHKDCRCMLCEMVPVELGKIIEALEKE